MGLTTLRPAHNQWKLEQGQRLRELRHAAGLSLKKLSAASGIGESTIRQYETGRSSGISMKSAHKLVQAFEHHGFNYDVDWLINGADTKQPPKQTSPTFSKESSTQREVKFFCENAEKPIVTCIEDEAMLPFYHPGTYVGGSLYLSKDISSLHDRICITTLLDGKVLVRKLGYDIKTKEISLTITNQNLTKHHPLLIVTELLSIAPVSRVWVDS